jgi:hypothetical protein
MRGSGLGATAVVVALVVGVGSAGGVLDAAHEAVTSTTVASRNDPRRVAADPHTRSVHLMSTSFAGSNVVTTLI